ncbi:MAG: ATP-binding protein, partial [Gammaproteobacteria bacterium]
MPLQVPLPFAFHGNEDFEAYHAGPNRQIVETLRMLAESDQGEAFVYVQGNPGLGKTHLVLATCTAANRAGRSAFYLPLGKFEQSGPSLLEGLE